MKKPPIGIPPQFMHDERRLVDIISAMLRYQEADEDIPEEWFKELKELTEKRLNNYYGNNK